MTDRYGIKELYPSNGNEWYNKWDNGHSRTLDKNTWDPYDSKFGYTNGPKLVINGDGTARIPKFYSSHRLFVDGPWLNTEMTVYAKFRGKVESFQMRSRSNHHGVKNQPYGYVQDDDISCGFGNYEMSWSLQNNTVQWKLEIIHDIYVSKSSENKPNNVPRKKWVGFKQVTRTFQGNKVKVEAWQLNDVSTQNWIKVTEYVFDGTNANASSTTLNKFSKNLSYCKTRGDKISGDINAHQIWLNPSKWSWIRIDNAEDVDLKFYSVREIAPL